MKWITITLSLMCLIVSGCCEDRVIVKPPQQIQCPAPTRPVLQKTTAYDPKIFFANFSEVVEYGLLLEKTVQCYQDAMK